MYYAVTNNKREKARRYMLTVEATSVDPVRLAHIAHDLLRSH